MPGDLPSPATNEDCSVAALEMEYITTGVYSNQNQNNEHHNANGNNTTETVGVHHNDTTKTAGVTPQTTGVELQE